MLTRNLSDWKYRKMWNTIEEYLNTLSFGNLINWSWILYAKNWAKLKTIDGGLPGLKIDRKASITSSAYSLVVYPRIQESMVIICLALLEKMVAAYGGLSVGVWDSSMMKVWKISAFLGRSSFV